MQFEDAQSKITDADTALDTLNTDESFGAAYKQQK